MIDDTGIFRTTVGVENPWRPHEVRELTDVMVETGSEYTWVPRDSGPVPAGLPEAVA